MNFFNLYFNCTFVGISDCHYLKSNFQNNRMLLSLFHMCNGGRTNGEYLPAPVALMSFPYAHFWWTPLYVNSLLI